MMFPVFYVFVGGVVAITVTLYALTRWDDDPDDYDWSMATILGFCTGLIWPVTLLIGLLFGVTYWIYQLIKENNERSEDGDRLPGPRGH